MKKGIIGRKLGMTQLFDEKGKVIPVTVISAGPCVVVQKRTNEKNGYEAVQLGYSDISERKLNKPQKGVFEKAEVSFKKYLKEFRLDDCSALNVGDVVTADTFEVGEKVDITGITKGHGYSGAIKRWGLHRLRMTHGTGPVHRQSGSMGVIDPARIFKNKKMAGQYGNEQVTMLNLEIVKIDPDNNLIAVKGAVPGAKGGIVYLRSTVK
ncbi:MAG: 50S ribosomal protein L3 [Ruminococcaceae bacterium]|nr:50S ribosomal protein L3 [Oscillospiraceae bacterium]